MTSIKLLRGQGKSKILFVQLFFFVLLIQTAMFTVHLKQSEAVRVLTCDMISANLALLCLDHHVLLSDLGVA